MDFLYSFSEFDNSIFHDIYTLFCGIQECSPLYSYGPAVRDSYIFHICTEGKGTFFSGEESFPIEAGQGFLIQPGKISFYQADREDPWTYVWISIDGPRLPEFLELIGIQQDLPIFSCPDTKKAKSYILDILDHNKISYHNEVYIQGVLLQFLSLLIKKTTLPLWKNETMADMYVNQAISYIHKNYQNPVSVQEIADYLSLNRSYLTELFVKTVHFSPQQFLMKYRITKATELLLNTDLPIQHIACSCGYSGNYAFTKAFKKITGLSPTLYRKEKKGEKGGLSRQDPHKDEKLYFTELR